MNEFTIGYLSWKEHNILTKTLESHNKNGLYDIIPKKNRLIFFQEISNEDKEIAKKFNCRYIGNKNNIGLLNAFIKLVENCKTKYFIFCENDFLLLDNYKNYNLKKCFQDVKSILDENEYSQVKLSNTKNPGFIYCRPSDINNWLSVSQDDFVYKIESFSWIDKPEKFYNNIEIIKKNYLWYKVKNEDQRWSNHIYACNTKFLKKIVLPIIKFHRDINPFLDIKYHGLEETLWFPEKILNCNKINKKISILKKRVIFSGGGNFYHNRYPNIGVLINKKIIRMYDFFERFNKYFFSKK